MKVGSWTSLKLTQRLTPVSMTSAIGAPIRVGVVGTGFGAVGHAPAFARALGAVVKAICSRRADRAESAADRLGIPLRFDD